MLSASIRDKTVETDGEECVLVAYLHRYAILLKSLFTTGIRSRGVTIPD